MESGYSAIIFTKSQAFDQGAWAVDGSHEVVGT